MHPLPKGFAAREAKQPPADRPPEKPDFNPLGERLNVAFQGQDPVVIAAVNRVYMGMLGGTMKCATTSEVVDPAIFATGFPNTWEELGTRFHDSDDIAYKLRFELPNRAAPSVQQTAREAASLLHNTVCQFVKEQARSQNTGTGSPGGL